MGASPVMVRAPPRHPGAHSSGARDEATAYAKPPAVASARPPNLLAICLCLVVSRWIGRVLSGGGALKDGSGAARAGGGGASSRASGRSPGVRARGAALRAPTALGDAGVGVAL